MVDFKTVRLIGWIFCEYVHKNAFISFRIEIVLEVDDKERILKLNFDFNF